jgi:hypothetical protein
LLNQASPVKNPLPIVSPLHPLPVIPVLISISLSYG